MDFWGIIMICFITFLLLSCCGYCCSAKKRGTVLSTNVVVTSATHTAPGGYPVTQMGPGTTVYPANMTVYPTNVTYPTNVGQMPMPMPMPGNQPLAPGMQPHMAPYPTMPAASMNPPSYDAAVSSGPQINNAPYEKQAPYNPSFTAH